VQDNIEPTGKWRFDEDVTAVFDNMLERSIPDYEDMRTLVYNIGKHYVEIGKTIIDIGCSNGNAIAPFISKYGDDLSYIMCDVSEPMLEKCRERFGKMDIRHHDITTGLPEAEACLVLGILTVQFTPIEYRQKIISSIYDRLSEGGAFIFVEKVLGNTEELDDLFVGEYYKMKTENSYTQAQIANKRKSLEGVLVPITAKWNEDMLKTAGFRKIDCFWRHLNFAGWIAIK
jgi:tRNA (cmo5U34)-methyltransferase